MIVKILSICLISICLFSSCKGQLPCVKIGMVNWTTENLDLNHFNNGDEILQAKTAVEWEQADKEKKPAWCYYEFGLNPYGLGRFYNWYAVKDPRGLAPKGYHIPTRREFEYLIKEVGGQEQGYKLKAKTGWETLEGSPANGTDFFAFDAKPSGLVALELGKMEFLDSKHTAYWWTSTPGDSTKVLCFRIDQFAAFITDEDPGVGMPVRLVKDF